MREGLLAECAENATQWHHLVRTAKRTGLQALSRAGAVITRPLNHLV